MRPARPAPAEWNRDDGFSAGDIGPSLDEGAAVVLLDADPGERHPYSAELDAPAPSPDEQVLYVRPAISYPEGHRMVVAIRHVEALPSTGPSCTTTATARAGSWAPPAPPTPPTELGPCSACRA